MKQELYQAIKSEDFRHKASKNSFDFILHSGDMEKVSPDLREYITKQSFEYFSHCSKLLFYVSTRHFRKEEHRANIMRGMMKLAVARFGPEFITDELKKSVPQLCEELISSDFKHAAQ